jgi:hypothetical protein
MGGLPWVTVSGLENRQVCGGRYRTAGEQSLGKNAINSTGCISCVAQRLMGWEQAFFCWEAAG